MQNCNCIIIVSISVTSKLLCSLRLNRKIGGHDDVIPEKWSAGNAHNGARMLQC